MTDTPLGKSKYDYDPDAHDWARARVEKVREKFERFLEQAEGRDNVEAQKKWKAILFVLDHELIGGEGCVIAAFDHRRAKLLATIDGAEGRL